MKEEAIVLWWLCCWGTLCTSSLRDMLYRVSPKKLNTFARSKLHQLSKELAKSLKHRAHPRQSASPFVSVEQCSSIAISPFFPTFFLGNPSEKFILNIRRRQLVTSWLSFCKLCLYSTLTTCTFIRERAFHYYLLSLRGYAWHSTWRQTDDHSRNLALFSLNEYKVYLPTR